MTDSTNRQFDDEKEENNRLIRQAILTVERTVKNFTVCRSLIENRGVSIEEFKKIKSMNQNIREFETSYAAHEGSHYHDDGIYWIAHGFVDSPESINFKIGLKAIEFIEEPAYNHVEIVLRFDEWLDQIDLLNGGRVLFKTDCQHSIVFRLPCRQVFERIGIIELLTKSFLFTVHDNYFAHEPAQFARVSRDFRKFFSGLNCNKLLRS